MIPFGSLCTGGGLADCGARAAGLTPVWGVELDPKIAAVAQRNDPTGRVIVGSVIDQDYAQLPRVAILHASPPCPNFSVAKTGAAESPLDLDIARAIVRAVEAQRPRLFTLENVRGYGKSQSLRDIKDGLAALGYSVTIVIVNAADYGVPQTRERLYLLAHAGGRRAAPMQPTHRKGGDMLHAPWVGWYAAIEDLIPTLPESQFARWQLDRLPQELRESLMVHGASTMELRAADEPSAAVVATVHAKAAMPRAFLVEGNTPTMRDPLVAYAEDQAWTWRASEHKGMPRDFIMDAINARDPTTWDESDPMFTITANMQKGVPRAYLLDSKNATRGEGPGYRIGDQPAHTTLNYTRPSHYPRAMLPGRVVAMTPRAVGRFQTLPDSYILPDHKGLACRIIGNGIPCDLYAAILRGQEVTHG